MGQEQRRGRRAAAAGGERTGVAVGHHVDRTRAPAGELAQQLEAMDADRMIDCDVLGTDGIRLEPRGIGPRVGRQAAHRVTHAVERPAQVDRGGPRGVERRVRAGEARVARIAVERECQSVRADRADQRRAAHQHLADGQRRDVGTGDLHFRHRVRQRTLVEHLDVAGAPRPHQRAVARAVFDRVAEGAGHQSISLVAEAAGGQRELSPSLDPVSRRNLLVGELWNVSSL